MADIAPPPPSAVLPADLKSGAGGRLIDEANRGDISQRETENLMRRGGRCWLVLVALSAMALGSCTGSADDTRATGPGGSVDGGDGARTADAADAADESQPADAAPKRDCGPAAAPDAPAGPDDAGSPEIVVTLAGVPRSVLVDTDSMFWCDSSGGLGKCAKANCGATREVLASGCFSLLAGSATHLYWPTGAAADDAGNYNLDIVRCPKTGCQGGPQVLASMAADAGGPVSMQPSFFAVDDAFVYWIDGVGQVGIKRCPQAGCNGPPALVAPLDLTQLPGKLRVVLSDGALYWGIGSPGGIASCPVTGCSAPTVVGNVVEAAAGNRIEVEAVLQGIIYFVGWDQALWSCVADNCDPTAISLTTGMFGLWMPPDLGGEAFASDGEYLYWSESTWWWNIAQGDIEKARIGPCQLSTNVLTVAGDLHVPVPIAVDDSYVYWGDLKDQTIARARK